MTTRCMELAQWLPEEAPAVGESVQVTAVNPVATAFGIAAFPEAPIDTKLYGRKDAAWAQVPAGLPDAPADGKGYARQDAAWAQTTKAMVGLTSADNTADVNKPVSLPQQAALDLKQDSIAPGTLTQYWRGDKSWQTLNKQAVGLANVDNTSDATKPLSDAAIAAFANTVTEAPKDGKQYARKDAAWTETAASSVWIGDAPPTDAAKYPLWWDSTVLQLHIFYNDGTSSQWVNTNADPDTLIGTFLLEAPNDGKSYARKSLAWISVNPSDDPFKITDGTVAAPGLAWNSEPGLGFYRFATNKLAVAVAGARVSDWLADGPTVTQLTVYPRTAGTGSIQLWSDPAGTPNADIGFWSKDAAKVNFGSIALGTGVRKPVFFYGNKFTFDNHIIVAPAAAISPEIWLNSPTTSQQSAVWGGNSELEAGKNWGLILGTGDVNRNFSIYRYNPTGTFVGAAFTIERANGVATFFGLLSANSGITTSSIISSGFLELGPQGAAGPAGIDWHVGGVTDFAVRMIVWDTDPNSVQLQGTASNARLYLIDSQGGITWNNVSGGGGNRVAFGWRTGDGTLGLRIDNTQIGVIVPVAPSDIRLKKNVTPLALGLDTVMSIDPIEFEYDADLFPEGCPTGLQYGFDAEKAEQQVPNSTWNHDGYLHMHKDRLIPILWKAVQDLKRQLDFQQEVA